MLKEIKKYYFIQLLLSLFLALFILHTIELFEINEKYEHTAEEHFFLIAIVSFIFTLFNGCINALNFSYIRYKNVFLAFYLPIIIWCIPFCVFLGDSLEKPEKLLTIDSLLFLIYLEPIAYNLFLKRRISDATE